ncbi:hypothetical protein [Enterobacter cloacae]
MAYNIPASLTGLAAGAGNPANTPDIKHASSDFGAPGYGGENHV